MWPFERKKKPPPLPGVDKVNEICLFNESTDPEVSRPELERQAAAFLVQCSRDYAVMHDAAPPAKISVAMTSAEIPSTAAVINVLDTPEQDGYLGYHDLLPNGRAVAYVYWKPIRDNGGTLHIGANSLSQTISHELLEMLGDPYCNFWADFGDLEDAVELCDRVEGDSYDIDGIAVSNFLGPRAFRPGDGPYDHLGLLKHPFDLTAGGYAIRRSGGPTGHTTQLFAAEYPVWKRDLKVRRRASRGLRRETP